MYEYIFKQENLYKKSLFYKEDIRFHYIGTYLYIYCIILLNNYNLKLKFPF